MDALFIDHAILRLLWTNFHTVVPGVLYRANHPTPGNLRRITHKVHLKTLINLRGATGNGSDALSRETASRLELEFIDLPMRSRAAPKREQILQLAEIFRTMRRPALVHCKSGADRAGFAAAIFLLLEGNLTAKAKRQLALRYGHLCHAKTGILDQFLTLWAATGEGRKPFLTWVAEDYDEAALTAGVTTNQVVGFINDRILTRE